MMSSTRTPRRRPPRGISEPPVPTAHVCTSRAGGHAHQHVSSISRSQAREERGAAGTWRTIPLLLPLTHSRGPRGQSGLGLSFLNFGLAFCSLMGGVGQGWGRKVEVRRDAVQPWRPAGGGSPDGTQLQGVKEVVQRQRLQPSQSQGRAQPGQELIRTQAGLSPETRSPVRTSAPGPGPAVAQGTGSQEFSLGSGPEGGGGGRGGGLRYRARATA